MLPIFKLLRKGKILRGTPLDIFGYTAERRTERQLIEDYKAMILELTRSLTPANLAVAVELAGLPEEIRGFGHIKKASIAKAQARKAELLQRLAGLDAPAPVLAAAQ